MLSPGFCLHEGAHAPRSESLASDYSLLPLPTAQAYNVTRFSEAQQVLIAQSRSGRLH